MREVESAVRQVLRTLPEAARKIRDAAAKGGKVHALEVDGVLHALDLVQDDVARQWGTFVGDGSWHAVAHRNDLRGPRTLDDVFSLRFELFVDVLATVLDAAEANYSSIVEHIDTIASKDKPDDNDINLLVTYLAPGVTALAQVFGKLSAEWLVPLRDRGAFSDPPDVQFFEGGSFTFPSWPQAAYLRRIAPERPDDVATVIEGVPVVDNESVHLAFVLAAIQLPPPQAARVAIHESRWLGSHDWEGGLLSDAVQKLVVYLISGGERAAAVDLLRASLSLTRREKAEPWHAHQARMSSWEYEGLLDGTLGPLATADRESAKALLIELIDRGSDESSNWRSAIEDSRQNVGDDPVDLLLVHLRKLYETICEEGDGAATRTAVAELEGLGRPIYGRLALYLLGRHGGRAPELVVERATDLILLNSTEHFHELSSMIRDQFGALGPDEQERVVMALRANSSEESIRSILGADVSDGDVQRYGRACLVRWFAVLGDNRPPEVDREYEALTGGHAPEHPTFLSWLGEVRSGPNPPRRAAELAQLPDTELLEFLRSWRPSNEDVFAPSRRGLALEVKACASRDPTRFSRLARDLRELHERYGSCLLIGLHEAAQASEKRTPEGKPFVFDWPSVMDLSEWIVAHADVEISPGDERRDSAEDWEAARRSVVDVVLDAALHEKELGENIQRAWRLLGNVLHDRDPTEARVSASRMDDATLAINTVRGQALHAAIALAAHLDELGNDAARLMRDEVLDAALRRAHPSEEHARAVRAVIAQRLNTICALDRTRACSVVEVLFPGDDVGSWGTLWEAFLHWNGPTRDVFEIARTKYEATVTSIAKLSHKGADDLADHLTWLAAWGVVDASANGVMRSFLEVASSSSRHKALESLGRALHRSKDPIDDAALRRVVALWEAWEAAPRTDEADLAAFGWWFSSTALAPTWTLPVLERVLVKTGGSLDWDHDVAKRLAALAGTFPAEVAVCLARFVDGGNASRVSRCASSIRGTLVTLSSAGHGQVARSVASRLVARGWSDFRDLA